MYTSYIYISYPIQPCHEVGFRSLCTKSVGVSYGRKCDEVNLECILVFVEPSGFSSSQVTSQPSFITLVLPSCSQEEPGTFDPPKRPIAARL